MKKVRNIFALLLCAVLAVSTIAVATAVTDTEQRASAVTENSTTVPDTVISCPEEEKSEPYSPEPEHDSGVYYNVPVNLNTTGTGKKKFVLIGDSIAFGTGISYPEKDAYGSIVSSVNGYSYANYSVPGHTTDDLMDKLSDYQVIYGLAGADIIGISIGGNNFLKGNLPQIIFKAYVQNDYGMIDELIEDFYGQFMEILGRVRQINPNAVILVQTIYNPRDDYLKDVYGYAVKLYNRQLRQILADNPGAFTIVDVAQAFEGHAHEYMQSDKVHPNEMGHAVIAREYIETLYEMELGTAKTYEVKQMIELNFFERLLSRMRELIRTIESFF